MRIFPLSESALTIEFGNEISLGLNARALNVTRHFERNPFPGLIEAVPAYSSLTLFYDLAIVKNTFAGFPSAFSAVSSFAKTAVENLSDEFQFESRVIEIPVNFGEHFSLDLDFLSEFSGLTPDEVIGIFLGGTYRVYMLGFLPGFAYMGETDERIAAPRRQTPRTKVPKGSIGIAGRQTGIYPLESPGGWQIIGRTEMQMFTPTADSPCALRPGDEVRFVRAS